MKKISYIFVVFSFLLGPAVYGGAGLEGLLSRGQQEHINGLREDAKAEGVSLNYGGHSVAPVVGYEPVFKFCYGAAYFFQNPDASWGVDVNTNFAKVYQAHSQLSLRFSNAWELGFKLAVTKGFDPYYGEGGETDPGAFVRLWGLRSINRLYLAYKPTSILSVGPFVDFRVHKEDLLDPPTPFTRVAPDEQTVGAGAFLKIDTVKNRNEVRDGFVFTVLFNHVPASLNADMSAFSQLEGEFIVYKDILSDYVPDVVAAFHILGGMSFQQPSYIYKYRLGGSGTMRGYLDNRFRGSKYYTQQTELRFPIFKLLSGAAFMGFGDATDDTFTNPKLAYGGGIRIGIPPDYVSKIRIDMGFTRDSQGIYADFGQAF